MMAYISNDFGETIEKIEEVTYSKTFSYRAPEKKRGIYILYIYGRPLENDPDGVYRSSDKGKTWVLINENQVSGRTGDGNFLVGDMNTFGMVYISTLGLGIKYDRIRK